MKKYLFRSVFHALRSELLFISSFLFLLFFTSCNKENNFISPDISFLADVATIHSDTSIVMGENMKFIIETSSENSPITNLVVNCNESVYLDSGLYSNKMVYVLDVIKGPSPTETWSFVVMNKDRQISGVSVTITLSDSSDFNPVIARTDIRMGAQDNALYGSFYSSDSNVLFFPDTAYINQSLIDVIYYFDIYECTLSSPNEADAPAIFTGIYGLSEWTIRNETKYFLTALTEQDFYMVSNDSLLIASYDPVNAKRKGKNAAPGQVWSFRLHSGKLGLMFISETLHGTDGTILFSLKVQQ